MLVGIRPSTVKRHLADLRARSGLPTEQLIYAGRAFGRLVIASLGPAIVGMGAVRLSLGRLTTEHEIDQVLDRLAGSLTVT